MNSEPGKEHKGSSWADVKDHPILVVLSFCAAAIAATTALYETIVIPNRVKVLEAEVYDLNRQLAGMPNTEKTVIEKIEEITKLNAKVTTLKQRVVVLSKDNVFSADDPYPKAFRLIRLGDPFSKVEQVYPGQVKKTDPDNTYASVKVDDHFFSDVAFYYNADSNPHRVSHILFHIKKDVSVEELVKGASLLLYKGNLLEKSLETVVNTGALKAQLTERYGSGVPGKRETVWKINGVIVTLKDEGLFRISMR